MMSSMLYFKKMQNAIHVANFFDQGFILQYCWESSDTFCIFREDFARRLERIYKMTKGSHFAKDKGI